MLKDKRQLIAFLLPAILLGLLAPYIRDILNEIQLAAITEKEGSQEILIESQDIFQQLSNKELLVVPGLLQEYLDPLLKDLSRYLTEGATPPDLAQPMFSASTLEELAATLAKHEEALSRAKEQFTSNNLKFLISHLLSRNHEIEPIVQTALSGSYDPALEHRNQTFLRDNLSEYFTTTLGIAISLAVKLRDKRSAVELTAYMLDRLSRIRSGSLIDMETPYFSLPPEHAAAKETQIFSFLSLDRGDPIALLALVELYLEMRNVNDAEFIFDHSIRNRALPPDLEQLRFVVAEQIKQYRLDTRRADLVRAVVTVEDSLTADIEETYELSGDAEVGDNSSLRALIILPFPASGVDLYRITDGSQEPIPLLDIRASWKDTTVVEVPARSRRSRILLRYRTSDFFRPSAEHGTFAFRYGGLVSLRRLACDLKLPASLKLTGAEPPPLQIGTDDDQATLVTWIEPKLPFRINVLRMIGHKNGFAGEVVSYYALGRRLWAVVFVVVLFFFTTMLGHKLLGASRSGDIFYSLAAIATMTYLMNDIAVLDTLDWLLKKASPSTYRYVTAALWLAFIFFIDRRIESSNKFFSITRASFEVTVVGLAAMLYLENIDMNSKASSALFIIIALYFIFNLVGKLAASLEVTKSFLWTTIFLSFFFIYAVSRQIGMFGLAPPILTWLGIILGTALLLLVWTFYLASIKDIENRNDQNWFEIALEEISLRLERISRDSIRMTLVVTVVLAFFLKSVIIPLAVSLVAALVAPKIESAINRMRSSAGGT